MLLSLVVRPAYAAIPTDRPEQRINQCPEKIISSALGADTHREANSLVQYP
ncbi:hypothetical protein SpAn4DRAFT_3088 [Sporomusa ovata]|uniref:Uncharacterized protein n=2 Tax=Sporomusa ovata TaxID=2378 RepID=A0A0U1KYY9_9FIRM|nr:hypothetical protein SpAn4DRAFT_3088 [Sporomusa ovata]